MKGLDKVISKIIMDTVVANINFAHEEWLTEENINILLNRASVKISKLIAQAVQEALAKQKEELVEELLYGKEIEFVKKDGKFYLLQEEVVDLINDSKDDRKEE